MSEALRSLSSTVAQALLRIGAVSLSPDAPYTWASGRYSPVYCDNRLAMAHPEVRSLIAQGFEQLIVSKRITCDGIMGTATAGIPHAAWLAERMNLPMGYVRNKPKGHGRGNQIEGFSKAGSRVVVIEDLVSTGMSSTAVISPLREVEMSVEAVLAIFTYGLSAADVAFEKAGTPLHTLTSFPELIEEAARSGSLSGENLTSLQDWYKDPSVWSAKHGGAE
ncbi:MAG: orotate phosphoribosyltransferase [Rhodothermales bacterium]|nr:orotate phosphoribosyltransferase [Rhodothermales bacterium]MDG2017070.1 orotate phosphoribosyltransferase [Rhodothermales bacterium]HAY36854.1 orotate phosphoribosyltransferase [Bacteroidota bacterium]